MKLKINYMIYYFLVFVSLFFIGCSDLREPVPTNSPVGLSVHPLAWADTLQVNSADFHANFIQKISWDLKRCRKCHGTDYTGGIANVSCLTCHPATPEGCTVCHGGVDNLTGAPPEDLMGNRNTDASGVGAHTTHLNGRQFTLGYDCENCHFVPDSLYAVGHADSELPAELTFSRLALTDEANPQWDENTLSCTNVYCHGNWSLSKAASIRQFMYMADNIEGNNSSPKWTDPASVACGTCHNLPPEGHNPVGLDLCGNCHSSVIDANGTIIDKSKHVNGQVNVFGEEYPMF